MKLEREYQGWERFKWGQGHRQCLKLCGGSNKAKEIKKKSYRNLVFYKQTNK